MVLYQGHKNIQTADFTINVTETRKPVLKCRTWICSNLSSDMNLKNHTTTHLNIKPPHEATADWK